MRKPTPIRTLWRLTMTAPAQDQDVVSLLISQHNQVKALFARVKSSTGEQKRDSFQDLVRLLAVHESAEEQVVHPAARHDAGDSVVEARLHEEDEAKHVPFADTGDHPGDMASGQLAEPDPA